MALDELTQQDGLVAPSRMPEPDAHNYTSWCKVYAVYGESFTQGNRTRTGQFDAGGRPVYKNPSAAELRRKLLGCRAVTQWLGRQKAVEADDARTFRRMLEQYVDSSNAVQEGSSWPIVRKVTAEGRDRTALRTGATLVDTPGVNDNNGARDRVVKEYLKNADSVWIVSNIKRALNDRTAKGMLSESFRRQLLMDGQYGQIVFVATQSDDLHASELRNNLGLDLPPDMPLKERRVKCAAARNAYTKVGLYKLNAVDP
jgi:hypothetical protein